MNRRSWESHTAAIGQAIRGDNHPATATASGVNRGIAGTCIVHMQISLIQNVCSRAESAVGSPVILNSMTLYNYCVFALSLTRYICSVVDARIDLPRRVHVSSAPLRAPHQRRRCALQHCPRHPKLMREIQIPREASLWRQRPALHRPRWSQPPTCAPLPARPVAQLHPTMLACKADFYELPELGESCRGTNGCFTPLTPAFPAKSTAAQPPSCAEPICGATASWEPWGTTFEHNVQFDDTNLRGKSAGQETIIVVTR